MGTHESSRTPSCTEAPASQLTLAGLLAAISADEELPAKRRADMCSGVRSLCRALGLQIESTPANPQLIASCLTGLTPAGAGMRKSRLQNCKCHIDAALAYADEKFRRRRSHTPLAPVYKELLQKAPDRWTAARLRRLFHYATECGVDPSEIDDAFFDRFANSLQFSLLPDRPATDRTIRKDWNALSATVPGWPGKLVGIPSYVDHYVLPANAFPASLWADLEDYLQSRCPKGAAAIDDLLDDDDLFGDGETGQRRQYVRESTAALIRYRVRQFASALVLKGVKSPEEITSLAEFVAPQTVSAGLKFFIERAGGEPRNSQIRGMASDLLMIAKLWTRSPDVDIARLTLICKKVRPRHDGLPESALRSLAPFRDPARVRAFLALPDQIVRDVEKRKVVDRGAANRIAAALWIKIAQRAPLRISNLLSTDLSKNLLRAHNGKGAAASLYYPPDQVKNAKPLEAPLSPATVALLDLYLGKYRKALVDGPSPWLFVGSNGPKLASVMSADIQRLMNEYLGFAINPHSFRHVAAKLYLSVHPGRYVDVQLLLGHRKLETTVKYYCQLEAEEVFRHFDAVLLGLEEPGANEGRRR